MEGEEQLPFISRCAERDCYPMSSEGERGTRVLYWEMGERDIILY
jgi:hypothetical protein